MTRLMILGAGGHGKVVAEIAELIKLWDEIVFLDDKQELKEVNGYRVIGTLRDYKIYKDTYENAFVAIGDNKLRIELVSMLLKDGLKLPVLIHPFTGISNNVRIEMGSVVMAGVVINSNSTIGKGCIINTSSSVGHDCLLEDGVHVSPGVRIGGTTHIGKNSWICIGSNITNNITIGQNAIVASGAAVIRSVRENTFVGGIPARVIKELD